MQKFFRKFIYDTTAEDGDRKPTQQPPIVQTKEEAIAEFNKKNDFFASQIALYRYGIEEIKESRDFIAYLFNRQTTRDREAFEPFEDVQSAEYRLWLNQKQAGAKTIDYRGYACWRYNPLVFYIDKGRGRHRLLLRDDWQALDFVDGRDFALISPVTYVGRNNTADNARYLYAFVFDLDGVDVQRLGYLFQRTQDEAFKDESLLHTKPMPNIVVNSGHGLHLYYLLQEPVPLYPANRILLNKMKFGLTNILWTEETSMLENRQWQGVLQSFRIPGTKTKFGERVTAFKVNVAPEHTLESLNSYLAIYKLTDAEIARLKGKAKYNPTSVTLSEAAKRWPEWYATRIIEKRHTGHVWHVKRDVYNWWLNRLRNDDKVIAVHHRYWCILTLVVYGVKCGVPREEVLADGYSLVEQFDKLTNSEDNHFTRGDVDDAMKAYDEQYCRWPIATIENTTLFRIEKNRRNGRKQEEHLKIMNFVRDNLAFPDGNWRDGNGRKKGSVVSSEDSRCAQMVRKWQEENPDSHNKSACARDTGLDRKTVRKWWGETEKIVSLR